MSRICKTSYYSATSIIFLSMGFIPSKICSSSSSEYVNQNEFYVVDFSLHDIQSSKTETSLKHRSRNLLVHS